MNRELMIRMLLIHFVSRAGSVLQFLYLLLIGFLDTTTSGHTHFSMSMTLALSATGRHLHVGL